MSIIDDMIGRPTEGEKDLRERTLRAQEHAESLEEAAMKFDPKEATDPAVHSKLCWDRQVVAMAFRKAAALQSQLNGAENRRYSRSLLCWMFIGISLLMAKGTTPADLLKIAALFMGG